MFKFINLLSKYNNKKVPFVEYHEKYSSVIIM